MKNKTLAYIAVFIVGFGIAVVLVTLSGSQKISNLNEIAGVLPASINLVMTIDNPEDFFQSLDKSLNIFSETQSNAADSLYRNIPIFRSQHNIESVSELERKSGISCHNPIGVAFTESFIPTPIFFMTVKSKTVFKDFLKESFNVESKAAENIQYFELENKTDINKEKLYLYMTNNIAFILTNELSLKKMIDKESERLCNDELFTDLTNKYSDKNVRIYINMQKVGAQFSNFLMMMKPGIIENAKNSLQQMPEQNIPLTTDNIEVISGTLVDLIVAILKAQKSVLIGAEIEDDILTVDIDNYLNLDPKTIEIFKKKMSPNPLLQYFPEETFFLIINNSTLEQDELLKELQEKYTKPIAELFLRDVQMKEEEPKKEKINERTIFAMYPGSSVQIPYRQMVLSYTDKDIDIAESSNKEFSYVNEIFDSIKSIIPLEMKFEPGTSREYKGITIYRYHLKMIHSKIYIENQKNKTMAEYTMMPSGYDFEIGKYKDIEMFAGGDSGTEFGNFVIDSVVGKGKSKIIESSSFKEIRSKCIDQADFELFICLTEHVGTLFKQIEMQHPANKSKVKSLLDSFEKRWNFINIKTTETGILTRLYIDFKDIKQMSETAKALNYLNFEEH